MFAPVIAHISVAAPVIGAIFFAAFSDMTLPASAAVAFVGPVGPSALNMNVLFVIVVIVEVRMIAVSVFMAIAVQFMGEQGTADETQKDAGRHLAFPLPGESR